MPYDLILDILLSIATDSRLGGLTVLVLVESLAIDPVQFDNDFLRDGRVLDMRLAILFGGKRFAEQAAWTNVMPVIVRRVDHAGLSKRSAEGKRGKDVPKEKTGERLRADCSRNGNSCVRVFRMNTK
jgi:hypothetical protein